ncbi:MAG: HAMP domain-containing protein [Thermoguttaceae bacterium]|nr:HAMP domain-containing protein [Thermoguttaceae bacterium]
MNLLRLGQASDAILREDYRSIQAVENMRSAIQRQEAATMMLLVETDRSLIEKLSGTQQQFLLNLAQAKDNVTVSGESEILGQLELDFNEAMFHFTQFVGLPRTDTAEALGYYREHMRPGVAAIERGCDRLLELNQTAMMAGSHRAQRVAHAAVWSMLLVGCGAIVIGVLFSLVLSTRISQPVRELVDATKQVAEGNYNVVVTRQLSDEFADLANYFNAMVAKLRVFHELRVSEILAEKKKTETILQTIDDGICVVDGEGRVVGLNPAAVAALGLEAAPWASPTCAKSSPTNGWARQSKRPSNRKPPPRTSTRSAALPSGAAGRSIATNTRLPRCLRRARSGRAWWSSCATSPASGNSTA